MGSDIQLCHTLKETNNAIKPAADTIDTVDITTITSHSKVEIDTRIIFILSMIIIL